MTGNADHDIPTLLANTEREPAVHWLAQKPLPSLDRATRTRVIEIRDRLLAMHELDVIALYKAYSRPDEERSDDEESEILAAINAYEGRVSENRFDRRRHHVSFVYFVRAMQSGAIKIGVAKDPEARLRAIQGHHHEELVLLATTPGTESRERALHERFAQLRIRGEWYRGEPELLEFIALVSSRET